MTDSMKFGPEWLRNLSSEAPSTPRYPLAEHRYGREEMLALFDRSFRAPDSLVKHAAFYVEQTQLPLALIPMTEDENRLWQGRAPPPAPVRGRGTSLERGRGRGRGGTFHQPYMRSNSGYEERGPTDRNWNERNGDTSEWTGAGSPRKEFGVPRSGPPDNWRRHRSEDDEGWRSSSNRPQEKWGRANWRDGDSGDDRGVGVDREKSRLNWHSRGDSIMRSSSYKKSWDNEDHLPEWATVNPSESGGSFDSTGAFHGSDDDPDKGRPFSVRKKSTESANQSSESPLSNSSSKQPTPDRDRPTAINAKKDEQKPVEKESIAKDSHVPVSKSDRKALEEPVVTVRATTPVQTRQTVDGKSNAPNQSSPPKTSVTTDQAIPHPREPMNNNITRVDDEFVRMQEVADDIVAKLMLDEEPPKKEEPPRMAAMPKYGQIPSALAGLGHSGPALQPVVPSPSIAGQDKWFYRDPQGQVQGPFTATEMTEWYQAGYFSISLLVRRQCDERYFTLGDLVKQSAGHPFLSCRILPLKNEPPITPKPEADPNFIQQVHLQALHQQLLFRQAEAMRALSLQDPLRGFSALQQREFITQHMLNHPQVLPEVEMFAHSPNPQPTNPLMHMINQMQQANKLPMQSSIADKPPNSVQPPLDPLQQLIQQMGGLQQTNRPNVPIGINKLTSQGDQSDNDPIKNLLRQLNQQPQNESPMWARDSYSFSQEWLNNTSNTPQMPPPTLWDMHNPIQNAAVPPLQAMNQMPPHPKETVLSEKSPIMEEQRFLEQQQQEEIKRNEKVQLEIQKKNKEREKKLQEEKAKEEQKKLELEKQKKEAERAKKELEKAKKEAEEKRQKELEEKKRLKELKKAEEAKRKEEEKKREEERLRKEKEAAKKQADANKKQQQHLLQQQQQQQMQQQLQQTQMQQQQPYQQQSQQHQHKSKVTAAAPWSQPVVANTNKGTSLAEIQRAEKEKKAEQAALMLQQQKAMEAAKQLQAAQEKVQSTSTQFKWAQKPIAPSKVKSLAEIQAEEQERLAKQAQEARSKQEKEPVLPSTIGIWGSSSQNLTWGQNTGFWDESQSNQKQQKKVPPTNLKAAVNHQQAASKPIPVKQNPKPKIKKEEQQVLKIFDKNSVSDEFTTWCTKTLSAIDSSVDIPTFVSFLRDIESPYEVKEYVRMYLGENPPASQFANQFIERRSRVKQQQRAALQEKDDMCVPAPAINPSSTDFQEVKSKGKKSKKAKMLKVDSRILGFSVTAAEGRINVGERDLGENI